MNIKVFNSRTQAEIAEIDLTEILDREEAYLIGRSADASLVLDSADVSRLHGKFFQQDANLYYMDLGSRNGSSVNGNAAEVNQNYLLKAGDLIQAGEFTLVMQSMSGISEDATVMRMPDATIIRPLDAINAASFIEGEIVTNSSSALVKVSPHTDNDSENVDDPKHQTLALFSALNKRVLSELQATGNLTRDTYIKAVRRARQTIEQTVLIDPEEIEKETEKNWQSFVQGTSNLSGRVGSAAAKKTSELGSRLGNAAAKGMVNFGSRLGAVTKAALGAAWQEMKAPKSPLQKINPSESEQQDDRQEVSKEPDAAQPAKQLQSDPSGDPE